MNTNEIERALGTEDPRTDTERGLERLRASVAREGLTPVVAPPGRRISTRGVQGLAAAATVVLVASALALSGVAGTVLTIFEPKSVTAVPVSQADLAQLGGACRGERLEECIGAYGTFAWTTPPQPREVRSLPAATAAAGFDVLAPSSLPQGVTGTARYGVINRSTATFTFSAEAARASAAKAGRTIPPLPKDVDGAKLTITGGPAAIQVWGATDPTATTTGPTGSAGGTLGGIPTLVIGQAKAPTVTSDGVTVDELRGYLLQQPGISPQLAAALRAITDPSSTLPVPVPAELAISHPVKVQGVDGLFIGDSTGLGSAVIWQKDGMMFEVLGTLTESQVLAVANSLK